MLAAAWFTLCGHDVAWPLEPCVYDLLVSRCGLTERVQVKTTTSAVGNSWAVRITQGGRQGAPYDPDDIDKFFIISADMRCYLIPSVAVAGLSALRLSAYAGFRLPDIGLASPEIA